MTDIQIWIDKIRSGDRLALSKAITLVESESAGQQKNRQKLIEGVENISTGSFRLAVTGVPGAGKSTLIDKLGMYWIEAGYKVAVLAIDPSSTISHGSILGDKTRMSELSRHSNAFVRPSPTRLQLGGVASTTFETILLCEAAGFDRIIVETVGVGQSETIASQLTDCCLLLLVTGTGDDLQGVKKGILESADFILVNKADGGNVALAKSFARELKSISALWPTRENGKKASVLIGSSIEDNISKDLQTELDQFFSQATESGWITQSRIRQKKFWLEIMLRRRLEMLFQTDPVLKKELDRVVLQMEEHRTSVVCSVEELIRILRK